MTQATITNKPAGETVARSTARPCPTCDHVDHTDLLDAGPPTVVACTRCGMVFNDVADDVCYSGAKYAERTEADERRYVEVVHRILTHTTLPLAASILDVGCATGGLMEKLRRGGFTNVYGIDPSEECAKKAKANQGTLADVSRPFSFGEQPWDCVVLSHVLEHVRDVSAAMAKLEEVADSVHVEVPDGLRYGEHVKSPYQNWNAEHVNHFDLEHLNMLFHAHGFALRACGEYICEPDNFPAVWAWFTRRASLRERQEEYGRVSANAMRRVEERVRAVKGPVIAWGIGALARRLEPVLKGKVFYGIDKAATKDNDYFCDRLILTEFETSLRTDLPILVTTILHQDAVLADIKRLELKNEVITLG